MRSLISILVTYLHSLVSILIELNNLASSLKPQARKLSQKFSSLLHLRLKSTNNEALLEQA